MKKTCLAFAALAASCCLAAPDGNTKGAVFATAALRDGSVIRGEFGSRVIRGSTAFRESLALDPALVRSVTFSGTNGAAKVELSNGDRFSMTVANGFFSVRSIIGGIKLPVAIFRSLSLSPRGAACGAEDGLVFHCTFDDDEALSSPLAGPPVKLLFGKVSPEKGRKGGSLFVLPGVAGAQIDFPAGSFGQEGCIEFWAELAGGKTEFTTGGDPRFFLLADPSGREFAILEFASNNGCGNSGLGGHVCGLRTQTNSGFRQYMPYADVFRGADCSGWHHYAFVWSRSQVAVYLDGRVLCSSSGVVDTSSFADSGLVMDIPLNQERGRSFNNKSAFYIDELKVWNFAKKEFICR